MRILTCILLGVFILCSPVESSAETRRALLIGVDIYEDPNITPRQGAGKGDVETLRKLLIDCYDFKNEDITCLVDREATTQGIIDAFRKNILKPHKATDVVVIVFSTHGSQVADLDGDEADGLDEIPCTYDVDWQDMETWLTDDIIRSLIDSLKTQKILTLVGACHSGTMTRSVTLAGGYPEFVNFGFLPSRSPSLGQIEEDGGENPDVLLAACKADEVSYRQNGVGNIFLQELARLLRSNDGIVSSRAAVNQVGKMCSDIGTSAGFLNPPKTWTPVAEGPEVDLKEFLTPQTSSAPSVTPSPPQPLPTLPATHSGDIHIELKTNQQTFREGERMKVTVTPNADCYLRLYYLSAEREIIQIFPNLYQQEHQFKAGEARTIGGAGAGFELRMSPPFGNEILMAVGSSEPFTDESSFHWQNELFKQFEDTDLQKLAMRGITVTETKSPVTGRALQIYRVVPSK